MVDKLWGAIVMEAQIVSGPVIPMRKSECPEAPICLVQDNIFTPTANLRVFAAYHKVALNQP